MDEFKKTWRGSSGIGTIVLSLALPALLGCEQPRPDISSNELLESLWLLTTDILLDDSEREDVGVLQEVAATSIADRDLSQYVGPNRHFVLNPAFLTELSQMEVDGATIAIVLVDQEQTPVRYIGITFDGMGVQWEGDSRKIAGWLPSGVVVPSR